MEEAKARLALGEGTACELNDQQRYTAKLREAEIEAIRTKKLFSKDEIDAEARRVFDARFR